MRDYEKAKYDVLLMHTMDEVSVISGLLGIVERPWLTSLALARNMMRPAEYTVLPYQFVSGVRKSEHLLHTCLAKRLHVVGFSTPRTVQ